jgi:hypothetical protein
MSTRTVQLNYNTRPVRIAFLVEKPDPVTLENVFRLNTLLWGGYLNPIVVLDGSTRKQLGPYYVVDDCTYEEEQFRLLKAFDPDILINYSNAQLPALLEPFKKRTFPLEVMRWNPWGTQETMAFLEVWPFLEQHWRKEFRFPQKPQEKYGYIDLGVPSDPRTFLVARFGCYPEGSNGNAVLANNFDGKLVTYDEDFRKTFSPGKWVFPINITILELDIPVPSTDGNYVLLLLDAENMFDIVDYWNLRAAGYRVFALPTRHYRDLSQSAKLFAEQSIFPINQNVTTRAELVIGGSVDDSTFNEAREWFLSLGVNPERLSLRRWVPRFRTFDRDSRIRPQVRVRPPISHESSEVVVFNDGHGSFRASAPDCELRGPYLSQHWATEIRALGTTDERRTFRLPWLRPECDALVDRKIGHGLGPYASRVSQLGLVTLRHGDRENVWIEEPEVTQVLRAYLRDGGFAYQNTSTPGLTLERIVEQMGGLRACAVFQNSGVREVIESLGRGSRMPANDIRRIIYKSFPDDEAERQKMFVSIRSRLVESKVLRQGFELQCARCRLNDWYHLSDLGADFRCKKCFHDQQVSSLDGSSWYYVSDGLFRLEGKVAGCLTTILALLFLSNFVRHEVKYAPSFNYADGSTCSERDFALFASDFFQEDADVIIGECKSLKELKASQRDTIRCLGERTGAYLAFCTLSDAFSSDDRLFFEQLVVAGLRPILLTRKHLELSYTAVGEYRHEKHWFGRDVELVSRLTIHEVLGSEFAVKHHRRI